MPNKIISINTFKISERIYELIQNEKFDAALIILSDFARRNKQDCKNLLLELCNDYDEDEALLCLRNFLN